MNGKGYQNTPVRRPSIRQEINFRRRPALFQQVVTELRRLRCVSTERSETVHFCKITSGIHKNINYVGG